jgi:hypothetical protein
MATYIVEYCATTGGSTRTLTQVKIEADNEEEALKAQDKYPLYTQIHKKTDESRKTTPEIKHYRRL